MEAALLLVLLALAAGIALQRRAKRRRAELGLPAGDVVYQDSVALLDETLFSRRYRLAGRPDYLLRDGNWVIPVEVKTGRTPNYPYPGQVMQCVAYCVLVEEHFGVRPPYGIILFEQSGKQFTIDFTPEAEHSLAETLRTMRHRLRLPEVHRSHTNPMICAACGFRDRCEERIG